MLLTRDEICQDSSFEALTDAILERDQPRTHRSVLQNGGPARALGGRGAQRGDGGGGALCAGAQPHQRARRPDHTDQQRPHNPRPAHLGEPHVLRAGGVSPAAAAAERLVHPGGSRYLEPAARTVPRSLRHDEGAGGAAHGQGPGGVERASGANRHQRIGGGAAARAHDRHHERRRKAFLRPVSRLGG